MNELRVFENNEFGQVRGIEIDGEGWLVGKDVAERLGYANTKDAILTHVDEEDRRILQRSDVATIENHIPKSVLQMDFVRGDIPNRGLTIINESGLYSLVLSSKLPQAKAYKRWVTHEVLPSIRKTGSYSMDKAAEEQKEIKRMEAKAKEMNAQSRQAALWLKMADKAPNSKVHQQICAAYASEALAGHMVFPLPVVEKSYTAVEVGKRYGISANRVGRIANAHGMKTEEYGMYVMDKAPNSMKDIETFRYNERGAQKIGEYLRMEG